MAVSSGSGMTNKQVATILGGSIRQWEDKWTPLYDIYKDLHRNPGRSGDEGHAADQAAGFLQSIRDTHHLSDDKFFIKRNIGGTECDPTNGTDCKPPSFGPSVVGVFKNGDGSTVLLRADMDALPVVEKTGLPYASNVRDSMHACGHDLHTAALMAATQALIEKRKSWSGTLIACFQPGEESGLGAQGMVNGGLYRNYNIPIPDFVFGGHVTPEPSGTVSLTRGTAYSKSDSWKITVKDRGGHGSRPESTIDPITIAAYGVTRLQTIVSRVVPSQEAGVLTVGQISGGTAENIIPETAYIKVNTRANSDELAAKMKTHIWQIMDSEVAASIPPDTNSKPEDPNPFYEDISHLPLLKNEDKIADEVADVFKDIFTGESGKFLYPVGGVSGSEDFAVLARSGREEGNPDKADIAYCYWRYGSTDAGRWVDSGCDLNKVPSNHNDKFYPQCDRHADNDPLKMGASALCAAALSKFNFVAEQERHC